MVKKEKTTKRFAKRVGRIYIFLVAKVKEFATKAPTATINRDMKYGTRKIAKRSPMGFPSPRIGSKNTGTPKIKPIIAAYVSLAIVISKTPTG